MDTEMDKIPVRLPSGTKAIVYLPRPFTLADGIHLMNFIGAYVEEKSAGMASQPHAAELGSTDAAD